MQEEMRLAQKIKSGLCSDRWNMIEAFKNVCTGGLYSERAGSFSYAPKLPGWSFRRLIYGAVLPPPAVPLAFARGQGFPP
jgi:hypothetical protein